MEFMLISNFPWKLLADKEETRNNELMYQLHVKIIQLVISESQNNCMLFWASVAFFFFFLKCPTKQIKNPQIELMFCINGLHKAMYQNMQRSFLFLLLDFLFGDSLVILNFFNLFSLSLLSTRRYIPISSRQARDTTGLSLKTCIFHKERIWDRTKSRNHGSHFSPAFGFSSYHR